MRIHKKIVFLLCCCIIKGYAQQDPQFAQYMYNTMVVNPGFTGSQGGSVLTLLGRTQWVGVEGAPNTQNLSFHTLIFDDVGVGANIMNDDTGRPVNQFYLEGNSSYAIQTSEQSKLSLGLKLGVRHFNIDISKLDPEHPSEVNMDDSEKISAVLGTGVYYYTNRFYFGLSVNNLLPAKSYKQTDKVGLVTRDRLHFYAMAGFVTSVNQNIKFKPAALLRSVSGVPITLDVSGNFLINDKFNLGLSYRLKDSYAFMLGVKVNTNLYIGYTYDLTTSSYRLVNNGSHELVLRYIFGKTSGSPKCPYGGLASF